jgi:hypothetical protein
LIDEVPNQKWSYLASTAPLPVWRQTIVGILPASLKFATFSRTWKQFKKSVSLGDSLELGMGYYILVFKI